MLRVATVLDLSQPNQPRPDRSPRTLVILREVGDVPSRVETLRQLPVLTLIPGLAGATAGKATVPLGTLVLVEGSSFERFNRGKQRPNTLRVLKWATVVYHLARKRVYAVGEGSKNSGGSLSFRHMFSARCRETNSRFCHRRSVFSSPS